MRRRGNSRTKSGILSCWHLPPFLAWPITGMKAILRPTLRSVERGLKVADDFGYPMYRVIGPLWATAALTARGPAPKKSSMCGLLGKLPAENRCIQMPLYRILLATEFGRIGEIERARSFAALAEALVKQTGERWAAPEILSDPRLAAVSLPIARRPGCHALVQTLACLCQEARGGRLGIAKHAVINIARLVSAGAGAHPDAPKHATCSISTRAKFASAETSRDLREGR